MLGASLLWGECASPVVRAGVTATEVSSAGKALFVEAGAGEIGPVQRTFSTAAICFPWPNENLLSSDICSLMRSMQSLHSGPRSWVISFSISQVSRIPIYQTINTYALHSFHIGLESDLGQDSLLCR